MLLSPAIAPASDRLASEDFESGLDRWALESPEQIEIRTEPGTENRVLQLTPKRRAFAHAILDASRNWRDVRFEGRFLFPTAGDGYLGFIYNYQETPGRIDFGCIYVKSNGSYVRVSPHYDGNPSWRLYEDFRFDLEADRRVQIQTWYRFRLDVRGHRAELFVGDMASPVVRFDLFPNTWGALGLEARPGGGESVWVDDLLVTRLPPSDAMESSIQTAPEGAAAWQIRGPTSLAEDATLDAPELPAEGWRAILPDLRGAVITGLTTQYRSGENDIVYLRTSFDIAENLAEAPTWLAVSAANRIDVWLNGYYRGTVAPERFIWSDYLSSDRRPGARLPLAPSAGANEIILRVHGRNFAGGGFYADLIRPSDRPPGPAPE